MNEKIEAIEIYKQHYAHFGRMNDLIYKLPLLYSTLIGGLWYFAVSARAADPVIAVAVFLFAAIIAWYSRIMTERFRKAFNIYIARINAFDREYAVSLKRDPIEDTGLSTLGAFKHLLMASFCISLAGASYVALVGMQAWLETLMKC